ncbi:thiol reductant ABC exporter subunit CydC [Pseudoalteromonas mariniglutinosa]|uniref:thiol reductant ABC exporter subunit CydC n=1 Tax=Pseudoalteromonas mariniglutinosa TaxID=206042 RepID=UPI00384D61B5
MNDFLRLLALCKPHAGMLLLGAFLATLTVLANVGLLAISGWFLAAMAAAGLAGVQMNYFTPAGVIRFLAIVRTASRYGERLVTHNVTFLLLSEIRVKVFATLAQLNNVDLAMSRSADLINRMQNDVDALDKFYLNVLLPIIVAIFSIPVVLLFMAAYNTHVALLCFTALMIIGVILPAYLGHRLKYKAEIETQQSALLRAELADTLKGARELAIYQAAEQQLEHCNLISHHYNQQLYQRHKAIADSNGLSLLVVQLSMLASVFIIVPIVNTGAMANVELAMMSLFVLASFETVLALPNAFIQLPLALSAAKRIFALEDKLASHIHDTTQTLTKQPLGLSLRNISYHYDEAHLALANINITIAAGEKVALVGASGSGKSTLVNLLTGLWPVQTGCAELIAGHQSVPLATLSNDNRFELISIVAQQHHIFDGTLRDNLRYAAPSASDQQLLKACQQAQLGAWLDNLEAGLNTRLGTAGRQLSQGQARRVALAQALLRDSEIVILDEPTESLDNRTKHSVINTLMEIMRTKTVLTITHDPALLNTMHHVIWLERGKVRAIAKHHELLAEHPDYVSLITRF